jgi:hypothetical protein
MEGGEWEEKNAEKKVKVKGKVVPVLN